jgi:hypothetical protein
MRIQTGHAVMAAIACCRLVPHLRRTSRKFPLSQQQVERLGITVQTVETGEFRSALRARWAGYARARRHNDSRCAIRRHGHQDPRPARRKRSRSALRSQRSASRDFASTASLSGAGEGGSQRRRNRTYKAEAACGVGAGSKVLARRCRQCAPESRMRRFREKRSLGGACPKRRRTTWLVRRARACKRATEQSGGARW